MQHETHRLSDIEEQVLRFLRDGGPASIVKLARRLFPERLLPDGSVTYSSWLFVQSCCCQLGNLLLAEEVRKGSPVHWRVTQAGSDWTYQHMPLERFR